MDNLILYIEIFAFVTGVPYIVLEILQKNSMWYFGIATGIACAVSFAIQHLWASMGLNIYYTIVSFWGLYQWKKDARRLEDEDGRTGATVHLTRMNGKTILWSTLIFIAGTSALVALLRLLDGQESNMDAIITMMSAVAMFWLGKSYPQHWLIWIIADFMMTILCVMTGLYWMAVLYGLYMLSAMIGMRHWMKNGAYVT